MTSSDPANEFTTPRVVWIDVAKGIGIVLVVFGHCAFGLQGAGLVSQKSTLITAAFIIYLFHMPAFFFLSGLLIQRRLKKGRGPFLWSLIGSLIYPQVLWCFVQDEVIFHASNLVNKPINGLSIDRIISFIWLPDSQFWFLANLTIMHCLSTVLFRRFSSSGVIVLGLLLYPIPEIISLFGYQAGQAAMLVSACHFYIFYAVGVAIGPLILTQQPNIRWVNVSIPIAAFTLIVIGAILDAKGWGYWSAPSLIPAIAGTLLILSASFSLSGKLRCFFSFLGSHSLPIFILHIIAVAGTRIVLNKFLYIQTALVILPFQLILGILLPILTYNFCCFLNLNGVLALSPKPRMQ